MGMMELLFGTGRNVVAETVEVFRANAEGEAERGQALREAALKQFGAEFALPRKGVFDQVIDGLNRVPRPAMALGTIGLFIAALVDPVWFGQRMAGIALVPEPLWWLLGAIVSFYFGARHQAKGQDFQRDVALTMAAAPRVMADMKALETLRAAEPERPEETQPLEPNAALAEWRARAG
ncbi:Holin of 3TMs, for gene-transfer release [Roseivivax halotolerans]|uniref:Holin of 3TMs, for gene-transfer release n=1 Tax=Roseivivax halotolerans TaxID=93684 RepID=A0A1I5XD49_9RHOB|nr:holin family protein [Roseivivax halotolerans]SFQ29913.1 Holin of 3TMs, for gene-transfer release [Roseivivax halotolerans]